MRMVRNIQKSLVLTSTILFFFLVPNVASSPVGVAVGTDLESGDTWSCEVTAGPLSVSASASGNSPDHNGVVVEVEISFTQITGRTMSRDDSDSGSGSASASEDHTSLVPAHPDNGAWAQAKVEIDGDEKCQRTAIWLPIS